MLGIDYISTHAPLAGRDGMYAKDIIDDLLFQPTRPLRGATAAVGRVGDQRVISTHAPLAGRDLTSSGPLDAHTIFQPTRPLRGATSVDSTS